MHTTSLLAILLSTHLIHPSQSHGQQTNVHFCTDNQTISVQIFSGVGEDTSCKCQTGTAAKANANQREDYAHKPGVGTYKLHTIGKTWNEARKVCQEEGAHLAIINSKAEEQVLLEILRNAGLSIRDAANRDQAYLGIHDHFHEGEWLTIHGETIYGAGYADWSKTWWGGQPDGYKVQNCGALVVHGGIDDVACVERFAYFCEMPSICG